MENKDRVFITECPRDAMQGMHDWVPTEEKIIYINSLLKCGFETIDFGSFVSPKAIPQMRDTAEVLKGLELASTNSELLAIVANERGAEDAVTHEEISYLGYPFSISETFQQRNTNASIEESLTRVEAISNLCSKHGKKLVLYISMGFGNPYGDEWNPELVANWSNRLSKEFAADKIALSDTVGAASPQLVKDLFSEIIPALPSIKIGAHLHTVRDQAIMLTKAAYEGGCRYFDGAVKGFGGCPMAKDDLTGNMPTELMLDFFNGSGIETGVDETSFAKSMMASSAIFH